MAQITDIVHSFEVEQYGITTYLKKDNVNVEFYGDAITVYDQISDKVFSFSYQELGYASIDEAKAFFHLALDTSSRGGVLALYANFDTTVVSGVTIVSQSQDISLYETVVIACLTNSAGTLFIEFSNDDTNWDSSLSFKVIANRNEVHRIGRTRKYFRVRYTPTSSGSFFRLQSHLGTQPQLTSALNSLIQSDADATLVRPLDFNLMVGEGLYENRQNFIKDGINFDIDSTSTPEDISNEGGLYSGFPNVIEEGQIVVAGADIGTVVYTYLASSDDTDYTFATLQINGAGTYNLGHNIWRSNFAYYIGANGLINSGAITIRHRTTTTNVFCIIDANFGQTFCGAYTVPKGSAIYLDRITGSLRGSTSGSMDGYFYYKPLNESPRLRFPFELSFGTIYFDDIDYLIKIPQQVDIIPRIISSSANNLQAKLSYRFIKVIE